MGAGLEGEGGRGLYAHRRDLLCLDSRRAPVSLAEMAEELWQIRTLLKPYEREKALKDPWIGSFAPTGSGV